jgi:2-polyprenyl-3-methyl-5-hydroxy-6-metoxy-1,4-benzoquinol methylase
MDTSISAPTQAELLSVFNIKHPKPTGWGPRMRLANRYFTPDEQYEALVSRLVVPGCAWADVGCGRDLFPDNKALASELSKRAGFLAGIDPDANVLENEFLTERFHGLIEDYPGTRQFDVITLRMVAEHIADPNRAMAKVATMLKPGGSAIIYTPYKWSPMSLVARAVPFSLHNPLKWLIWRTESRDTFPVEYKLNTRKDQQKWAERNGLRLALFTLVDDCRVSIGYKPLHWLELRSMRILNALGLHYPEMCILSVVTKPS